MKRTEEPPASVGQLDLVTRIAEVAGIASAVVGFALVIGSNSHLEQAVPIALGISLTLAGVAQIARIGCRRRRARKPFQGKGYGRLCVLAGIGLLVAGLAAPPAAAVLGVPISGALLWLGMRAPKDRRSASRRRGSRPARLALLTIACLLLGYVSLAGALLTGRTEEQQGQGNGSEPPSETEVDRPSSGETEPLRSYADLCPALPEPLDIDHGLGELFRRDGAVKAGCGTQAFKVPGTATWVAAGICQGERRSVAVSAPGRSAITYGEAAEFIWEAAQEGTLTAVEAAAPEGGDVVLVETTRGTYGFARAVRSATPGNEDARQCNEVGGTAEPFAEMPPPLVWLWTDLIHDEATWFWPMPEDDGDGQAVVFASALGVPRASCSSDASCWLEFEDEIRTLKSTTFVTLDDLREYMPAEASAPA